MRKVKWIPCEAPHSKDIMRMIEVADVIHTRILFDPYDKKLYKSFMDYSNQPTTWYLGEFPVVENNDHLLMTKNAQEK